MSTSTMKRFDKDNLINGSAKKARLQLRNNDQINNDDDIWGDDPAMDQIEKCLELATQQISTQDDNNIKNLTCYERFETHRNNVVYTSTQAVQAPKQTQMPSTSSSSSDLIHQVNQLKLENKELKNVFNGKDGEIKILRSQLQQMKKLSENEKTERSQAFEQNQQQSNTKLNEANKNVQMLQAQLKLKNLEVVNLKEKLTEVKKFCNLSVVNGELNCSQVDFLKKRNLTTTELKANVTTKKCRVMQTQTEDNQNNYCYLSDVSYPLQISLPSTIFENENSSSCSNSQLEKCYPDINFLMQCSKVEFNSDQVVLKVFEIINTSYKMLLDLLEKLQHGDENDSNNIEARLESMEEYSCDDCIFSSKKLCQNEREIELRRCFAVVSILILYCKSGRNYFFSSNFEFLNTLLNVIKSIGKLTRSYQFSGFLASALTLLSNLFHEQNLPKECYSLILEIFQIIIDTGPSKSVLKYVSLFLKRVSAHSDFVLRLCEQNESSANENNVSNGECLLRIIAIQIQDCVSNPEIVDNMFQFFIRFISCNLYCFYGQQGKRSKCSVEVFTTTIKLLSNSLENYMAFNTNVVGHRNCKVKLELYHSIFRNGVLLLDMFVMHAADLITHCSHCDSQYYKIVHHLNRIQNSLNFERIHKTALESLLTNVSDASHKHQEVNVNNNVVKMILDRAF